LGIIGRTLGGRYKVIALLGKGGMGVVYEAEQLDLHRRVAIKVLVGQATHAPIEREQLLRFKQEALAVAGLAHPNIVQVLDFVDGDEPMLVMELLRGKSLTALVKENGKLEPARAVALMTQVLSALQAAHDARIVHRDVKPENIFVCASPLPYELVKVLDFGLARPLDESRRIARTVAGVALGTPAYMAPEQARGSAVDVRMDVFAAGVTLYYALSGRRPFEGKTSSELVRAVSKQPPLPLDALCPDLDLDLVRVVERSLSKDPDARFSSARAFLESLPSAPNAVAKPAERRSKANDTTAGTRKRAAPGKREGMTLGEITVRSPTVAAGMATLARFAPDGASALALGPSGLARWTLGGGWSARELPPGVTAADVRGIASDVTSALIFDTAGRVYVRVQGAFSALDVPPRLGIHGAHLEGERVALAGSLGDEGVVVEMGGAIRRIGRGIIMRAVTRSRSGALVACGSRGTVCVIDDRGVHAHVAGRSTLVAIAALEEGFIAVGEGGVIVHAAGATVATATETKWVDDDLTLVSSADKLFCAVGRRVHVASASGGTVSQPISMSPGGSIRDAWIGVLPSEGGREVVVRVLTSSAAVVECRVSGVP
jgi:hypothetical protein